MGLNPFGFGFPENESLIPMENGSSNSSSMFPKLFIPIFYPTFYIPLYTPSITTCQMFFFSFLINNSDLKQQKKIKYNLIRGILQLIEYKVKYKKWDR